MLWSQYDLWQSRVKPQKRKHNPCRFLQNCCRLWHFSQYHPLALAWSERKPTKCIVRARSQHGASNLPSNGQMNQTKRVIRLEKVAKIQSQFLNFWLWHPQALLRFRPKCTDMTGHLGHTHGWNIFFGNWCLGSVSMKKPLFWPSHDTEFLLQNCLLSAFLWSYQLDICWTSRKHFCVPVDQIWSQSKKYCSGSIKNKKSPKNRQID